MSTTFARPEARVASSVSKKMRSFRSIQIRMSEQEDVYDSDTDSFTKRTMRRGKRTSIEGQSTSVSLRSRRTLRKRQVVTPAPAPAPDAEEEGEDEEDEEDSDDDDDEEDDEESSDSSDSSDSELEGAEGEESDSSLDSISSGSEDESEEEEEEEETPPPGMRFTQTDKQHFHTLVPGAGSTEPSQVSGEAPEPTGTQPSSAVQPTGSSAPSSAAPTETLVNEGPIPDSESGTGIPQITSTIVDSEGAAATGDAAGQVDGGSSGPSRGAEVGIVIGTLALAALLIAGAVFWYRRRRQQSNNDHLERLPDEKTLPEEPPTFRLSAPPPIRGQRTQSSIMDEAMGAAYQHEMNGYEDNNLSQDFYATNYNQNEKTGIATAAAPVSPVSPGANNLSPRWVPSSPRTQQPQPMSNFQLFPAPTPPPMVPQPVAQVSNVSGPFLTNNPPQQNGFRFEPPPGPRSVAPTETTDDAGTWSTFANERMKANGGKLPLKERMLGHF